MTSLHQPTRYHEYVASVHQLHVWRDLSPGVMEAFTNASTSSLKRASHKDEFCYSFLFSLFFVDDSSTSFKVFYIFFYLKLNPRKNIVSSGCLVDISLPHLSAYALEQNFSSPPPFRWKKHLSSLFLAFPLFYHLNPSPWYFLRYIYIYMNHEKTTWEILF